MRHLLLVGMLCLPAEWAVAAAPGCVRGPSFVLCDDGVGNRYSVENQGADTYTRGLPISTGRYWLQTATRYGQLTLFSGVASDGEVWTGRIQKMGWTTLSRFSSSRSGTQSVRCNRLTGCSQVQTRALSLLLAN